MTGFEIIGREEELASLGEFLRRDGAPPAALVLEGEAGIGKSTLWRAGVEQARALGIRVLAAQPAEAEQALAHVALADLLEDDLDEVLRGVSTPRRRALETALHLDETADTVDPLALGIATRSALQVLAEERALLLAIDDLQWLDASSARALAFALRRLGSTPVRLLGAHVDVDPGRPLAVPETLEELVRARISGLPAPTREALALASTLGTMSEGLFERAGVEAGALEPQSPPE